MAEEMLIPLDAVGGWPECRDLEIEKSPETEKSRGCLRLSDLSVYLGAGTRSQRGTTPAGSAIMLGQSLLILGTTYS